jgi:hypothetical protein
MDGFNVIDQAIFAPFSMFVAGLYKLSWFINIYPMCVWVGGGGAVELNTHHLSEKNNINIHDFVLTMIHVNIIMDHRFTVLQLLSPTKSFFIHDNISQVAGKRR